MWAQALAKIIELLQTMLAIDDGLLEIRLREILLNPTVGFAPIVNMQEYVMFVSHHSFML